MKILACTDAQGDCGVCSWLAETARRRELDALVLAGHPLGISEGYDVVSG